MHDSEEEANYKDVLSPRVIGAVFVGRHITGFVGMEYMLYNSLLACCILNGAEHQTLQSLPSLEEQR